LPVGLLKRACACGNHSGSGGECAECRKKREGMLQRAAVHPGPAPEVPPIVHDVLRSPGQPLDASTRAFMEPRFGHDFSDVRVHTDSRAAESAAAVSALAYTVGQSVVFGAGQFAPGTGAGRRLLAHELTHTVQQQANHASSMQGKLTVSWPGDAGEREAEAVEQQVLSWPADCPPTIRAAAPMLQRSCADGNCATCEGGDREMWVTAFFRRRATVDAMGKLRAEIDAAKAVLRNCCINLKFDFNWSLLPGSSTGPAYAGNPAAEWHFTPDEQAVGTGTTFSGSHGIPMLVVDDIPLSGGGVTVDRRFDAAYSGRSYFMLAINQTTTPNTNCSRIAHELWHLGSGLSDHNATNGAITACTGNGVTLTFCNAVRSLVAPRGDFPTPPRGEGSTRTV